MSYVIRKRGVVTGNFPRKEEFHAAVLACLALAKQLYPEFEAKMSGDHVSIVYFNTGTTAGYMKRKNIGHRVVYNLEYNTKAMELGWDHTFYNTIPHEIAHLVNIVINGRYEASHGPKWKRISKRLGCSGERCHSIDIPKQKRRPVKRVLYIATCGTEVKLTMNMHYKIQDRGQVRILRGTGGKINADCFTGEMCY